MNKVDKKYYYLKKQTRRITHQRVVEETDQWVDQALTTPFAVQQADLIEHPSMMISGDGALAIDRRSGILSGIGKWMLALVGAVVISLAGWVAVQGKVELTDRFVAQIELGISQLKQGEEEVKQSDLAKARSSFQRAEANFQGVANQLFALGQGSSFLAQLPYYPNLLSGGQKSVLVGLLVAQSGRELIDGVQPITAGWQKQSDINFNQTGDWLNQALAQSSKHFQQASQKSNQALLIMQSLEGQEIPASFASTVGTARGQLQTLASSSELLAILSNSLSDILGFKNPRAYLLLFQNNRELRPNGGFIGSYARVEVENGKIVGMRVDDAHRLDGQIGYSALPLPIPLKQVVGNQDLGLGFRDVNWNPDFTKTVVWAKQLYEAGGGGSVDGVIAITPEVVEKVLDILGSVYLPERKLTLTSANFVDVIQNEIEVKGKDTTNPKQVLTEIQPILMERITNASPEKLQQLGKLAVDLISRKAILLNFNNNKIQSVLEKLGWAGSIANIDGAIDYLNIVRANLGGRKSSIDTKANYNYMLTVDSNGAVFASLTATFTNNGTYTFPGGDNRDYIRVLAPRGATLSSVQGQDDKTEVDVLQDNGKTVFGFWVTTPVNKQKEVTVNYRLPFKLKKNGEYILDLVKQPGATNQNMTVKLSMPPGWGSDLSRTVFNEEWKQDELIKVYLK